MVQGRTFKELSTGRYLRSTEVTELPNSNSSKFVVKGSQSPVSMTWEKMSKSKYNGVDPDQIVKQFGSDATRSFILFKAPVDQALEWDDDAIQGQSRWLRRVHRLVMRTVLSLPASQDDLDLSEIHRATHLCIKQVSS
jgi:leucyl-tRNA synthetase